jgi:homoserine dehydrogenase
MSAVLEYPPKTSTPNTANPRLRAVLLGCGTVNTGVLERLGEFGDSIEVSAIVTRRKRLDHDLDTAWLTEPSAAFDTGPDVIIEALPDCPAADKALTLAAERGIHIISANKGILARRPELEAHAARRGATVRYAAAVGGGVPVLETLLRLRQDGETINTVRGVLNGTSNFILEQVEAGASFETAVTAAQDAGFAEADPSADIDGLDAAAKLVLIARTAFDDVIDPASLITESLRTLSPAHIANATKQDLRYRQCAELGRGESGITGCVRNLALSTSDPLSQTRNEENCVEIRCHSGLKVILHGKGAGREPTANAMLSDLRALLLLRVAP